jgi:hypothetical protein
MIVVTIAYFAVPTSSNVALSPMTVHKSFHLVHLQTHMVSRSTIQTFLSKLPTSRPVKSYTPLVSA